MALNVGKIAASLCVPIKKHLNKATSDPVYIARFLLVASVAKDVFSYRQRAKYDAMNKKIPDDKKPFVVAMDKATALTTAIAQLSVGLLISSKKLQNPILNKLFKDIAHNKELFDFVKSSFTSLTVLVCSKLLVKRLLVPYVATHLAGKMVKKQKKDNA